MSPHTPHSNGYPQVVVAHRGKENDRVTWSRYLCTGALLLLALVLAILCFRGPAAATVAPPAANMTATQAEHTVVNGIDQIGVPSVEIDLEWDGPAVSLDWHGNTVLKAKETFVGAPVIVPGDYKAHSLTMRNDGPSSAVLDVWIDPAQYLPESAVNEALAEDVTVFWEIDGMTGSMTFAELLEQPQTPLAQVKMDQGETMVLTVGIAVDYELDRSQNAGEESVLLQFDVGLGISGERAATPNPLAITGGMSLWPLIICAILLFIGGIWLLVWRRSRDEEEEEQPVMTAADGSTHPGSTAHSER